MKYSPVIARSVPDLGYDHKQLIFRFDNGYGASVIKGEFTYGGREGLFELGVIAIEDDPDNEEYGINWWLTEAPSITGEYDNVVGHLTWEEVEVLLEMIEKLPRREVL